MLVLDLMQVFVCLLAQHPKNSNTVVCRRDRLGTKGLDSFDTPLCVRKHFRIGCLKGSETFHVLKF